MLGRKIDTTSGTEGYSSQKTVRNSKFSLWREALGQWIFIAREVQEYEEEGKNQRILRKRKLCRQTKT